jgi:hypothetical protein
MFLGLPDPLVRGTYVSLDPDPHPDPYKNVTDLHHWLAEMFCWIFGSLLKSCANYGPGSIFNPDLRAVFWIPIGFITF